MRKTSSEAIFDALKAFSGRVACSRRKAVAALVRDGVIFSLGYNGSCRGSKNCGEEVPCLKDIHKEKPLASYIHCPAVHGEVNAVINAARMGISTVGATCFFFSSVETDNAEPCIFCRRVLINAGIKDCFFMNGKGEIGHELISTWIMLENQWMEKEQHD